MALITLLSSPDWRCRARRAGGGGKGGGRPLLREVWTLLSQAQARVWNLGHSEMR